MSAVPPDESDESARWFAEAVEELVIAEVLAADERVAVRAACFHAHLAAEKALKSLLIRRGVPLRRIHDLDALHRLLPVDDQALFDSAHLDALNPWTMEGRYPADLGDAAEAQIVVLVSFAANVIGPVRAIVIGPGPA